jgi:hypothetical protein
MNEQIQPGQYRDVSRDEMLASNAKQAAMAEQKRVADPWVHRSAGMRCQTCIWYVAKQPAAAQGVIGGYAPAPAQIGRCRRHAPTMGGYPVVYMTDWCGDHRLDENKI